MNDVNLRIRELHVISVEFTLFIFALYGIKLEAFFLICVGVYLFVLCHFEFEASSKFACIV
jgi:hypothetical protein